MINFENASEYLKEFFNAYKVDGRVSGSVTPDKRSEISTLKAQVTNLVETMDRQTMILNRLMERLRETQTQVNTLTKASHTHVFGESFGDPIETDVLGNSSYRIHDEMSDWPSK